MDSDATHTSIPALPPDANEVSSAAQTQATSSLLAMGGSGRYDSRDNLHGNEFALFEQAVRFVTSLGVEEAHAHDMPPMVMTAIGGLLAQIDHYTDEIRSLQGTVQREQRHLKDAEITITRLRAQRNALHSQLRIIGGGRSTHG